MLMSGLLIDRDVLIEAPVDRIEANVALMQDIMRRASRVVLNRNASGTIELRTDFKIVHYPDRYKDKRGIKVWDDVMALLAKSRNRQVA